MITIEPFPHFKRPLRTHLSSWQFTPHSCGLPKLTTTCASNCLLADVLRHTNVFIIIVTNNELILFFEKYLAEHHQRHFTANDTDELVPDFTVIIIWLPFK